MGELTTRGVWLGICAAALLALPGPALAAGGPDIHAAEQAVGERLGKGARHFFPTAYETKAAVCGVVTTDDGDARFVVEVTAGPGGKRALGPVRIDGQTGAGFDAIWSADCG